jgi:outer membrane lipoprotein-sorting protein
MKPNYANIKYDPKTDVEEHIVSDGTTIWTYYRKPNTYAKMPADRQGKNITVGPLVAMGGFFSLSTWMQHGLRTTQQSQLTYSGKETVKDVSYDVVDYKAKGMKPNGTTSVFDLKIYIGSDNLIHQYNLSYTDDGKNGTEVGSLSKIVTGQPMTPHDFAFTIQDGAKKQSYVAPQ